MQGYLDRGKAALRRVLLRRGPDEKTHRPRVPWAGTLPDVRIAVAGAGTFARAHLDVLAAIDGVRLVGVCNRGGSDLTPLARQYGLERTFSDYRTMLDETAPDAVFVVVGHFETVRVAAECLTRGLACFVEKPPGMTSAETARLAALAAAQGCLNMVGVNRRYIAALHDALTAILQRGALVGIVVEAPEAMRRLRKTGRHSAPLFERWLVANNIHAIDLFRCFGGDVEELHSMKQCREEPGGDSFTAVMRLSRGCLGTYVSHWNAGGAWRITLYGDEIRAEVSLTRRPQGVILQQGVSSPIPIDPMDVTYRPGLFAQDLAFVSAVALGETPAYPASDLHDAVKTMALIEQIAAG